jgi:predicted esterase
MYRSAFPIMIVVTLTSSVVAQENSWWDKDIAVAAALAQAKANRAELEKALHAAPKEQRPGIAFLIANMPPKDLTSLKADFLLKNVDLAYQARAKMPWGKTVPEDLFLNDVLPYASVTETREPWRQEMMDLCLPLVKDCKTITAAAQALNAAIFTKLKVKYSTQRNRPDQSPSESIKSGIASCTGLSILLIDACRSVGVPARMAGIPKWVNKPGNHMWVEIWDGDWHFTGACEHDKNGLNRTWFLGDAALAKKDVIENAIYASSFKRTNTTFPLVWAKGSKDVFAENVTDRYTRGKNPPKVPEKPRPLSNEEETRVFESAKDYFDSGKKVDPGLDIVLRTNENAVRQMAWKAYAASTRHKELKAEFDKNEVKHDKHLSPYTVKRVGKKPKDGWPLFIAMHGGGGVPKAVNDSQWEVMKKYYRDQDSVEGYLYVALRAPNDVWNGFYDNYCCPLVTNLIRQFVLFGEADADRVFLMGYSHGGYGAFFIGPKMPDRFAAVHASAAAPTDGTISAKSLRNTRFTFMIGEKDTAYGRRERCEKFAAEIDLLRKDNPDAYPVAMEFQKGFGHGGLPDRDKIKDMYKHQRQAIPKHLTWEPTDAFITDFFWISIDKPGRGQAIDVRIQGNKIAIQSKNVAQLSLWLDQRLANVEAPLELDANGKTSTIKLAPSFRTLCESILRRGDLSLAACCRVDVSIAESEKK